MVLQLKTELAVKEAAARQRGEVAERARGAGVDCVESAVCMALKRLGLSFKKRRSARQSKTARMSHNDASHGSGTNGQSTPSA